MYQQYGHFLKILNFQRNLALVVNKLVELMTILFVINREIDDPFIEFSIIRCWNYFIVNAGPLFMTLKGRIVRS